MFAKFITSALFFLALTHGAVAIACGDPPLPACPTYPPCSLTLTPIGSLHVRLFLLDVLGKSMTFKQAHPTNSAATHAAASGRANSEKLRPKSNAHRVDGEMKRRVAHKIGCTKSSISGNKYYPGSKL
ncbi:hypothetical protein B0H11DRAFT_1908400 [Mycena galericulata]|nr:hypothetical protein B0H11DRAFT_1908400 [Mycena galericulata]